MAKKSPKSKAKAKAKPPRKRRERQLPPLLQCPKCKVWSHNPTLCANCKRPREVPK